MSETDRIVIEGIGVVGGFGCGASDLSRALTEAASSPGIYDVSPGSGPVRIPAFQADVSRLGEFIPVRTLRRIDRFSRLGLLGSHLALADAELPEAERSGLGIVIASGYGATGITFEFLKSFINDGDICASPTYFANSVHNSAAAHISIQLGAMGPNLTVTHFHLSVPSALATARLWLAEGRVRRVLFGAVDELSELIGYVRYRTREAGPAGPMTPLWTEKETSIPAEGAAFLLLARESSARRGYCTLEASTTGILPISGVPLPEPGLLVLGADGCRESGRRYAAVARNARVACYTSLYGSMPAGPAFDVAAAALVLKGGRVFPSPGDAFRDFPATVPAGGDPVGCDRIACLTLAGDEAYGLTTLGRLPGATGECSRKERIAGDGGTVDPR
ncbi:MAG: beta-ketoacyl synthase N-terminal-like domain-containing protein [Verrucomicrobiota bacterium]